MFAHLTEDIRAQLVSRATSMQLRAGAWLFRAGADGDSLYLLLSGRLEVVVESPEPTIIRVLGRGDVLGELALLTGSPRSASVRARRDCELLKLARDDFIRLLEEESDFMVALTRSLGEQLSHSRGPAIETPRIPATIVTLPLHAGLPARQLAEQIVRDIGQWRTAVQLT